MSNHLRITSNTLYNITNSGLNYIKEEMKFKPKQDPLPVDLLVPRAAFPPDMAEEYA